MSSYPPHPYAAAEAPHRPAVERSDRHRVWQLVAGAVAFVLAQLVAGTVSVLAHVFNTGALVGSTGELTGGEYLIGMCAGALVALVLYALIVGTIGKAPWLGLRGSSVPLEIAIGLGVGAVLIAGSVGLIALFGGYRITGVEVSGGILLALAAGIGAGFMEEILFRGFLLRILDAWLGTWWALILSSVLFGAVHLTNPEATWLGTVGIMVSAGGLLGGAYILTRRLWLPIAIHISWNFVQGGIFSSDISGTGDSHGLFTAQWPGPAWLTGGTMGMEGSVLTIAVAVIAAGGILHLALKHGMIVGPVRRERRAAREPEAREPDPRGTEPQ
ncbi:CPBP family intramembrane metalloprotease [Brevibacterium sp. 5221]|uniref:CPBP family intramembrane metalloprotease n=1 Tax=Brevibacterium rongguiense TaxID=2695267 RepID=A0A6N9HAD5_9MICO|nr:type II CAAX endopeptidase family protein [Brevibacterium rongguiense]MYM20681.1 CPBP family intramembrane metalloprotease [Brevibacterium rongguiense]